jgi:hypothetical protein
VLEDPGIMKNRGILLGLALAFLCAAPVYADSLAKAEAFVEAGEFAKALEIVKKLEKSEPENADVIGLLAQAHFELGRFKLAKPYLTKAEKLDPETWGDLCRGLRATLHFFYGEDKKAKELAGSLDDDNWAKKELPLLVDPMGLKRRKSKKGYYFIYTDAGFGKKKGHVFASQIMDAIHTAYSKIFPFKKDPKVIYRVYIHSTTAGFDAFNKSLGVEQNNSAGYFSPSTKTLVINGDARGAKTNKYGFSADTIDTMLHEGFHQFVHMFVPNIPMWFDEGLAEYFGPSQFLGKRKLKIGVVLRGGDTGFETRYGVIKAAIEEDDPIAPLSLKDFMSEKNTDFGGEGDRVDVNYAQAWSLIHFLLHSKSMGSKGKTLIKAFFKAMRTGKTGQEAFDDTFGKLNLDKLEKAWKQYVLDL